MMPPRRIEVYLEVTAKQALLRAGLARLVPGRPGRGCRTGGAVQVRRAVRAGGQACRGQLPGPVAFDVVERVPGGPATAFAAPECRRPFPQVTAEAEQATALVLLATEVLGLHSTVAVAAAMLAAAALFNPLRRRVQRAVDRRFNRARFDAEKIIAAFAARLKDNVDLDSVRDDLAAAAYQAMEPAHVSVWLNERG